MHETALMQNLIETAGQFLESRPVGRVSRVVVSVGKLANVMPDALAFAFEALTQGSVLEGAELEQELLPAAARCEDCGTEYSVEGFPLVCPACQSRRFRITGGEDVYIKSISYEEN